MRRGALLNDAQLSGVLPTSVGGRENADGNWSLMAGFRGPGSLTPLGFLALIAACGGSFGLPKLISLFTGAALAVVAVAARHSARRLWSSVIPRAPALRHRRRPASSFLRTASSAAGRGRYRRPGSY